MSEIQYKQYEPLFGAWYITKMLSQGSHGSVFEIERKELGITYKAALRAITVPRSQSEYKAILSEGQSKADAIEYFRGIVEGFVKEFALMSKMKGHSNIVSYEDYQVIEHTDDVGWDILMRMELLTPLNDYLEQHTLTEQEVIRLGIDLCKALEICQKYNIIHRDIKPENMFISPTGDFKLGEFGAARVIEKATGASTRFGANAYMAPEIYRGERYSSNVDIYSLGMVMYRLMNRGRLPFYPPAPQPISYQQREAAMLQRINGADLPNPVDADWRLAEIICKACASDPKKRYESPLEMRMQLEALQYPDEKRQPDSKQSQKPISPVNPAVIIPNPTEKTDKEEKHASPHEVKQSQAASQNNSESIPSKVFCKNCGFYNSADSAFCIICGSPLQPIKNHKKEHNVKRSVCYALLGGLLGIILLVAISNISKPGHSQLDNSIITQPASDNVIEWKDPTIEQAIRGYLNKQSGEIHQSELDDIIGLVAVNGVGEYTSEPLIGLVAAENPLDDDTLFDALFVDQGYSDVYAKYGITTFQYPIERQSIISLDDFMSFRNAAILGCDSSLVPLIDPNSNVKIFQLVDDTIGLDQVPNLVNLKGLMLEGKRVELDVLDEENASSKFHNLKWLSAHGNIEAPIGVNFPALEFLDIVNYAPAEDGYVGLAVLSEEQLESISQLKTLKMLYLSDVGTSLDFVRELTSLEVLGLGVQSSNGDAGFELNGIDALASLHNLKTLALPGAGLSSVKDFPALPALETLNLSSNKITDYEQFADWVRNSPNLREISISDNGYLASEEGIEIDVTPLILALTQMPNIETVDMSSCNIHDATALSALENVKSLDISYNELQAFQPLGKLTSLEELSANGIGIYDITPIGKLKNLQKLSLVQNEIFTITPLRDLTQLKELNLSNNQIADISLLGALTNIENLNLSSNQITNISSLANLEKMRTLNLSSNTVSDIQPLASLVELYDLNISYNQITDISPLANLTKLQTVWAQDTSIKDFTPIGFVPDVIT